MALKFCHLHFYGMALQLLYAYAREEITAITFLQDRGLLRRTPVNCGICGRVTTLIKQSAASEQRFWRCPDHKNIKIPLRKDSYWEKSKLSLRNLLELLFLWAYETPVYITAELTGVSENSIVQWFVYFRDICSWWLVQNPQTIGGQGLTVEIDESLVARRKNERGRVVQQRWVFGGVCRETGQGFLVLIPDKTAQTLLPLIEEHVAPGSTIHSDGLASYNNINTLPVIPPYQHLVVNHNRNFVDPQTGACTNNIECYWKNCKKKFKHMLGVHNTQLSSHLDEFMWRQIHGQCHQEALTNIILHLSQWYPQQ